MARCMYYPTPEQAQSILEEKWECNWDLHSMYDIPVLYPCSQECQFNLEMYDVKPESESESIGMDILNIWTSSERITFEHMYRRLKGRNINE